MTEAEDRCTDPENSMEKICIFVLFFLGADLWEISAHEETGVSGGTITIKCSHSYASTNVKYFCKGACNDEDVLISSRKSKTASDKRFTIKDEGNTFYVTISHLTVGDSGTYWCGIERMGVDTYNKVVLRVKEGIKKHRNINVPHSVSNETDNISSKKLVYIGASLGMVVLALAILLLIFFRRRNKITSPSSEKVEDTVYAAPSNMKQDGHITTSSSVSKEDQHTADTSRDVANNIYSNITISSKPQVEPDGLFYATVSFNRHTDCSTMTPRLTEVTYSAIECKSIDASKHSYCKTESGLDQKNNNNRNNNQVNWTDAEVGLTMRILLQFILFFMTAGCVFLLSVSGNRERPAIICKNAPLQLTAYHGGSVSISCKYSRAERDGIRSFCRNNKSNHCINLISTNKAELARKDKYSLKDNKTREEYNVTLSELTSEDTGRYRCAVERSEGNTTTCLTEIQLQISTWDQIPSKNMTANTGGSAYIHCDYPEIHKTNEKFLCKGKSPFTCEKLIQTTKEDKDDDKGRFLIRDNRGKNSFYVHISNVSTADSGVYWCGSDGTWQQTGFNNTRLVVENRRPASKRNNQPQSEESNKEGSAEEESSEDEENSPDKAGVIGGVVGGLVVLLILVVVLVLFRSKLPCTQDYMENGVMSFFSVCFAASGSSEQGKNTGQITEGQPDYEEIENQQVTSAGVVQTVYSTLNPPADQLHYASINFQKDSVSVSTGQAALPDVNKNVSSDCDYSSVVTRGSARPAEAERTVYSTVSIPEEP
ncbi:uncharacterized protein LOC121508954 [Cheilinus undulatus]|uniref:uncharacterized protein LOC121508954 n=1 Tax=Cheilinus undulatus TaxID=241271 RepID=UPI001BD61132|nr:uncharacterized protein LOC121508954 [Cheilinus undulatus]